MICPNLCFLEKLLSKINKWASNILIVKINSPQASYIAKRIHISSCCERNMNHLISLNDGTLIIWHVSRLDDTVFIRPSRQIEVKLITAPFFKEKSRWRQNKSLDFYDYGRSVQLYLFMWSSHTQDTLDPQHWTTCNWRGGEKDGGQRSTVRRQEEDQRETRVYAIGLFYLYII